MYTADQNMDCKCHTAPHSAEYMQCASHDEVAGEKTPPTPSWARCMCSVRALVCMLVPICIIIDLFAIFYKSVALFMAAIVISMLLCFSSSCLATIFIMLQMFIGIYYHSYVMNGLHFNMTVGSVK